MVRGGQRLGRSGVRSRVVPLVVGSLVALTGCGSRAVEISGVSYDAGSPQIQVTVDSCNRDPHLLVSEADEIQVSASVARRFSLSGGDDCQDVVTVGLREPVGARAIIDARTGLEVPVNDGQVQPDVVAPPAD